MPKLEASRTLVKSAPELWEVCSDPDSLGRHLQAFGEIRITRVEPETTVAWEGERASGTVRIEPSGWGTRVTLTAVPEAAAAPIVEPEPEVAPEPEAVVAESEPEVAPEPELVVAEPEVVVVEPETVAVPGPAAPQRGFFRRLGGLLFKSLVTPVEIPEEAFARPPAEVAEPPQELEPESVTETEPVTEPEPAVEVMPAPELDSTSDADPEAEVAIGADADVDPAVVLQTMLNRLGSDHHRPFSRS
jgi:hypothetical protein